MLFGSGHLYSVVRIIDTLKVIYGCFKFAPNNNIAAKIVLHNLLPVLCPDIIDAT